MRWTDAGNADVDWLQSRNPRLELQVIGAEAVSQQYTVVRGTPYYLATGYIKASCHEEMASMQRY